LISYFYFALNIEVEKLQNLNLSYFISQRISKGQKEGFASIIHKIAIVSIAIGLAASIVSFLIMKGFQETVKNKIYSFSGHIIVTKFTMNNSLEEQPMDYHIDLYNDQKKFPFIDHVQEYAHKAGLLKTEDEVLGVFIKGVGKSFDTKSFQQNIVEGTFIQFPDSGYSQQVVLSKTIATKLKVKAGDELVIHFFQNPPRLRKLKVTGIYETNLSEYFDSRIIIGDIRMIQRLNQWPDSVAGGLEVFVNPDHFGRNELQSQQVEQIFQDEMLTTPEKILASLGTYLSFDHQQAAIDRSATDIGEMMDYDLNIEMVKDRYLQVFEWLHLLSRQVNILLCIILTVVCVNMISIVLIIVMERTQMIGMLKAVGASNRLIRSVFVYNGIRLIVKGLLLGDFLGLGLCFIQDKFKLIPLNPKDYYMAFVPISWHWDIVLILNVLILFIVTVVLLLPTMVITSINPIRAIKFD
jgi:lipoprotein-releasing system permease protein